VTAKVPSESPRAVIPANRSRGSLAATVMGCRRALPAAVMRWSPFSERCQGGQRDIA
jgi:hypothetical protein